MRDIAYAMLAAWGQSWDFDTVRRRGEGLGRLLWRWVPERREMATEAVARALDLPRAEAEAVARASFEHSGRSFLELFLTRRVDPRFVQERLTIVDPASWEAFLATDRPCIVASGHMGAWEIMVALCNLMVQGRPGMVVVRRPKDQALHEAMTRLRSHPGMVVVDHRQAALKVLRCLKKNGTVGFLVDHNTSTSEAVFLPFLQKIAAVNMGPALLALRGQALIQPLFVLRDGKGGYELHTEPYLDTRELTGSREERVAKAALFYTRAVERMVRLRPEQWYWLHKRWKTQPPQGWTYTPPGD